MLRPLIESWGDRAAARNARRAEHARFVHARATLTVLSSQVLEPRLRAEKECKAVHKPCTSLPEHLRMKTGVPLGFKIHPPWPERRRVEGGAE